MAVYERAYKGYSGTLTPEWSRFLVLTRYSFKRVFKSRLFVAFCILCLLPSLVGMSVIYVRHNLELLEKLGIEATGFLPINETFFSSFLIPTSPWNPFPATLLGFVLVLIVGPPMISVDRAHNGMPLYLARPIRRSEYVAGKMTVLVALLSGISWIPGLLMYLQQAFMAGDGWLWKNLGIAAGIVVGSAIWIFVLSILTLAISASVQRKMAARILLFGVMVIPATFGAVVAEVFGLTWGHNLDIMSMIRRVWTPLMGVDPSPAKTPLWSAWVTLIVVCVLSVWLLSKRVRAYEVVRG